MVVLQRHTRHTRFLQNGRLGVCCCLIQTAFRQLPPTSLCNGGKGRFHALLRRHDRQPAHDHNQRKPNLSCIPSGCAGGGMLHLSKLLCITPPRRHCFVVVICVMLSFLARCFFIIPSAECHHLRTEQAKVAVSRLHDFDTFLYTLPKMMIS